MDCVSENKSWTESISPGNLFYLSAPLFSFISFLLCRGKCDAILSNDIFHAPLCLHALKNIFCAEKKASLVFTPHLAPVLFATRHKCQIYFTFNWWCSCHNRWCMLAKLFDEFFSVRAIHQRAECTRGFFRSLMRFLLNAVDTLTQRFWCFPHLCCFFPTYLHVGSDKFASLQSSSSSRSRRCWYKSLYLSAGLKPHSVKIDHTNGKFI